MGKVVRDYCNIINIADTKEYSLLFPFILLAQGAIGSSVYGSAGRMIWRIRITVLFQPLFALLSKSVTDIEGFLRLNADHAEIKSLCLHIRRREEPSELNVASPQFDLTSPKYFTPPIEPESPQYAHPLPILSHGHTLPRYALLCSHTLPRYAGDSLTEEAIVCVWDLSLNQGNWTHLQNNRREHVKVGVSVAILIACDLFFSFLIPTYDECNVLGVCSQKSWDVMVTRGTRSVYPRL